jgi:hypothetical protein
MRRIERVALLGSGVQMGDTLHPRLNVALRPIANKYREGKVKKTLKRELNVFEIAELEA